MANYPFLALRRLADRLFGSNRKCLTEQEYREKYSGVSKPVLRLVEVIESQLPPNAMNKGVYKRLSPGQKSLTEAVVYLEHHRLEMAKNICAEALDDPKGPGRAWVTSLIEAIDIAIRLPGTDPQTLDENRAAIDAQLQAKLERMDAILAQLKRTSL